MGLQKCSKCGKEVYIIWGGICGDCDERLEGERKPWKACIETLTTLISMFGTKHCPGTVEGTTEIRCALEFAIIELEKAMPKR